MKHFPFRLSKVVGCAMAAVYGLSSCTSDEPVLISETPAEEIKVESVSRFRSVSDAYEIAMRATSMLDDCGEVRARGGALRMLDVKNPVKVIRNPLSRSSAAINDTLMYVVNYADSMGFAVVSAVKGTPELIAVTMSGSYDPANPGDNPGFNMYMDNAAAVLGDNVWALDSTLFDPNGRVQPAVMERLRTDTVWINRVSNRVRVNWRQTFEEGKLCSNGIAGCAPLSVAMMMSGFKYPSVLKLYHSGYSNMSIDWGNICNHRAFGSNRYMKRDCGECDPLIHRQISLICRELGYRMKSNYTGDATSTTTNMVSMALLTLGYDNINTVDDVGPLSISASLKSNTILLIRGENSLGGHRWVCDAVRHYKLCYSHFRSYDSGKTWVLEHKDYGKDVAYYFYNWGWDGNSNGYYLDMNFKPKDSMQPSYSSKVSYIVVEH